MQDTLSSNYGCIIGVIPMNVLFDDMCNGQVVVYSHTHVSNYLEIANLIFNSLNHLQDSRISHRKRLTILIFLLIITCVI